MSNLAQPKSQPIGDGDPEPTVSNVIPIKVADDVDPLASFQPEDGQEAPPPPGVEPPAAVREPRPASAAAAPTLAKNGRETVVAAPTAAGSPRRSARRVAIKAIRPSVVGGFAVIAIVVAGTTMFLLRNGALRQAGPASALAVGHAVLNSRPEGALVTIDGVHRGVTPLEIDLPVGVHKVSLQSATGERAIALTVESGTRVVENVDLPSAVVEGGEIEVTSDPVGARVQLDGKPAGQTPLTLEGVSAGRHVVALAHGASIVNRTVEVTAGAKVAVFASLGAGTAPTGSFAVESPVELRLLENGLLLGLSNSAPLAVTTGRHQFELANDALEIRMNRSVTIEPGKTTRISVPAMTGDLSVNATPWAEVFVDGKSIGITPLGNVPVAVGAREVVWRHPQYGERRRTVTVGARTPVRVAEDMTR